MLDAAEPVLYSGSYVIDDGYAHRAARAFMVFQLRRPYIWLRIIPLLIMVVFIVVPLLGMLFDRFPYSVPIALGICLVIVISHVIDWVG